MSDSEVRAIDEAPELRAVDGGDTMAGHFARFDEWAEISSSYEGRFMESIRPGAFAKTIRERRDSIRVLFNHGSDPSVGDKVLGSVIDLEEDGIGARYAVSLFDTSYTRDLVPGLRAGVYGASFRFTPMRDEWDSEPARSDHNPEGLPERTIVEAKVAEFGPVTWPAYEGATAGVRSVSLTDVYRAARGLPLDRELPAVASTVPAPPAGLSPAEREAALRSFRI